MNKLASAALIITLLSSMFLIFNPVDAATSVSGSITVDTTWTKANSPYQITGWLTVEEGVTLTIEPGVTFDMGGWYMSVKGHLHAQGKPYDQIHFTAEKEGFAPGIYLQQQSSDCIIENVVLDKVGLTVRGSSTKIANNVFCQSQSAAIKVESSATITGNVFEDIPTKGISVTGDSTVTNNLFNRTTGQATAIIATGNAYVANNQIIGFYQGIALDGSITVENNIVVNCSYGGISSGNSAAIAKGNYVSSNTYGIRGGGTIDSNTIVNNEYGIIVDIEVTIKNNNIVNNEHGITLTTTGNFDATNNYWGTDAISVSQLITDSEDDSELGTVSYKPILDSPSSTAPDDDTVKEIAASTGGTSSALGFLMLIGDNVYVIAEIVIVGIVVAWIMVAAIVIVKRLRHRKRSYR